MKAAISSLFLWLTTTLSVSVVVCASVAFGTPTEAPKTTETINLHGSHGAKIQYLNAEIKLRALLFGDIAWIDDRTVIFVAKEGGPSSPQIWAWRINSLENNTQRVSDGSRFCFDSLTNTIRVWNGLNDDELMGDIQPSGNIKNQLVTLSLSPIPTGSLLQPNEYLNPFTCLPEVIGEYAHDTSKEVALYREDGVLLWPLAKQRSTVEFLNRDSRFLHPLSIPKEIAVTKIYFAEWAQAYFAADYRAGTSSSFPFHPFDSIEADSADPVAFGMVVLTGDEIWRRTNCRKFWWIGRSGESETLCVPYAKGGETLVPTKTGIFIFPEYLSRLGTFDNRFQFWPYGAASVLSLEIAGQAVLDSFSISPDGCSVAFAFSSIAANGDESRKFYPATINTCLLNVAE